MSSDIMFTRYAKDLKNPTCDGCKKSTASGDLQLCAACRSVRYCSQPCQRAHWKTTHKSQCASITAGNFESFARDDLESTPDGTSCFISGIRVGSGDYATRNPSLAVQLFEKAAKSQTPISGGHPIAMLCLGLHYECGVGVEKDCGAAFGWYEAVVGHEDPGGSTKAEAYRALARFYQDGLGTEKSEDEARKCLKALDILKDESG